MINTDYEDLRDKIVELFNPPDGDESEFSILVDALDRVYQVVEAVACTCDGPDGEPCVRCLALGRYCDVRCGDA